MRKQLRMGLPKNCVNSRNKAEKFEDCYEFAVQILRKQVALKKPRALKKFDKLDFAVQRVSPSSADDIVLGKFFPSDSVVAPRMVIYRAPIEQRAQDRVEQLEMIYGIVEQSLREYL